MFAFGQIAIVPVPVLIVPQLPIYGFAASTFAAQAYYGTPLCQYTELQVSPTEAHYSETEISSGSYPSSGDSPINLLDVLGAEELNNLAEEAAAIYGVPVRKLYTKLNMAMLRDESLSPRQPSKQREDATIDEIKGTLSLLKPHDLSQLVEETAAIYIEKIRSQLQLPVPSNEAEVPISGSAAPEPARKQTLSSDASRAPVPELDPVNDVVTGCRKAFTTCRCLRCNLIRLQATDDERFEQEMEEFERQEKGEPEPQPVTNERRHFAFRKGVHLGRDFLRKQGLPENVSVPISQSDQFIVDYEKL